MIRLQKALLTGLLWVLFFGPPAPVHAQDLPEGQTQAMMALLKEQNSALSTDLRRIQREIAALRADLSRPGVKDIFGGIGYIFGLFGVAAFVASRRKSPTPPAG